MKRSFQILSVILLGCFGLLYSSSHAARNTGDESGETFQYQKKADNTSNDSVRVEPLKINSPPPTRTNTKILIPENIHREIVCEPGTPENIDLEDASLFVPAGSVHRETNLSVTALPTDELPHIPPEIINVTKGYFAGYRFLPHGMIFDSAVYVSLAYDDNLLPAGYTPEDVHTFYYDETAKKWKTLKRDSIDHKQSRVVSRTLHFTDMIDGIIRVPESPATDGYVPTSMQNIQAADPSDGITQIETPVANNMGDATVSFPFKLPKGRQDMQPDLSLDYNSSEGSSWTGYGWSINIPAVSVDISWGVPRYLAGKESETYILNGTQLTPITYRSAFVDRKPEKRFYSRIEKDFLKIIRHGDKPDNYWWEVTDKTGTRSFYGGTPETGVITEAVSMDSKGNIGYWALVKTVDLHGNFISYSYDKPADCGQQIYLDSIAYTGFSRTEGPYKINFLRTDTSNTFVRQDQPVNARYGFITIDKELLRRIVISYNNDIIRSYSLRYRQGAFLKTLLDSITEYDATGKAFYTEHFDYYDDVQKNGKYQPYSTEKKYDLPDDGLKNPFLNPINNFFDNVSSLGGSGASGGSGSLTTTLGVLDGLLYSKSNTAGGNVNYEHSESDGFLCLVDINGDGLEDKVFKKDNKVYYRPNLSAHSGDTLFGNERVVQGLTDFSTSKTNAFGGGAEAYPLIFFVGYDHTHSKTETSVYFQDFNGDGLVDVADNGTVLFNHIDANGDPVFTSSSLPTPNPIVDQSEIDTSMLPDPAIEQAKLEKQFPLHDAVKMWLAPFNGTIFINAPVNLVPVTTSDQHTDGVRVSVQLGGNELWSTNIAAGDYSVKTPSLDSVTVNKGDKIFFRVHSIFNGSADKVFWDPEINYSKINSDDTLPGLMDVNGKQVGRFKASEDFILSGDQGIAMPNNGTVRVKVAFSKSVTSDTTRLEIFYYDTLNHSTLIYQKKYDPEQVVTNDSIIFDRDVYKNEYIKFRVFAQTTIDWSRIRCTNYLEYTYIEGDTTAVSADGSPLLAFRSVPDFYPMYNHVISQEFPLILDSTSMVSLGLVPNDSNPQTLKVFPDLKFVNANEPQPPRDIVFAVKKYGNNLEAHDYNYVQDTLNNKDTLSIQVQINDTLAFAFYIDSIKLAEDVNTAKAVLGTDSNLVKKFNASVFSTIDPANAIFGELYRGWGQFDYRGDSIWGTSPIDTNLLVPPTNNVDVGNVKDSADLGGINPQGEVFNVMVPYADRNLYLGVDPYVYVNADTISSSRQGLKDVLVPRINPAEASVIPVSREIIEDSDNGAAGASAGFVGLSAAYSSLKSKMDIDMADMNGDRFPDLMTTDKIQYTGVTGVLQGSPVSHNLGEHNSTAKALGVTGGGNYIKAKSNNSASPEPESSTEEEASDAKEKNTKRNNKSGQSEETAETSLGISIELDTNYDAVEQTWLDINGDGLPDMLYKDGTVRLNLGYSFSAPESWGFGGISVGKSADKGGGLGVNIADGSIEAGVGISYTKNEETRTFMDVNGDGLEDIVINHTTPDLKPGSDFKADKDVTVEFNTGNGFAPPVAWPGMIALNQGESIGQSANAAFTVGIPIPTVPPLKWCINPGGAVNRGVSSTLTELTDINGDGFPDVLASDAENEMYVKLSTIGRTNALKEIDQPLGSIIKLDYKLTPATYQHPGGKMVMASVKVYDGLSGDGADTTLTTFDYAGGMYNRHERQFYGYAIVKTNYLNTADGDSLYRTLVQRYDTGDYYRKGLLEQETLLDGNGKKEWGTQITYSLADIHTGEIYPESVAQNDHLPFFVALTDVKNYTYEGADTALITTNETYAYDTLGNISVYTNYSSGNDNDRYTVTTRYHASAAKNIYAIPSLQEVTTTEGLKRKTTTQIDKFGDITRITRSISGSDSATWNMEHDDYGNLTKISRPANYLDQRLWYQYDYDPVVHTYLTKITDAYGYSSTAEYNYKYGEKLAVTDKNDQRTEYTYDTIGRLTSVTGPLDLAAGNAYTIAFEYHPDAKVPYSLARHRLDSNSDLDIYTFIDGLGRVVQTKRSALLFNESDTSNVPGFIVSGKVLYDAFGRKTSIYQPIFENGSDPAKYNPSADNIQPKVSIYDVQDRMVQATLPDGSTSRYSYGASQYKGEPMHFEKITDVLGNVREIYTKANGLQAALVKVSGAGDIATLFTYNALGAIIKLTDPNGHKTVSGYDMLGRRISVDQPDAGLTEFTYDDAGNLIRKVTANLRKNIPDGGEIDYHYDRERLTEIVYPRNVQNRVNYSYGAPNAKFNRAGRITLVQDASGGQEFFYNPLGQIVKTIRTVQLGESDMRTFILSAAYDTWNRVDTMTYPDGEVVTYTYNKTGQLQKMTGKKLGRTYNYLSMIGYNKFGKQVYVQYGNGAITKYHYDDKLQRLDDLSLISKGQEITNNIYKYDLVGNILGITANGTPANDLGGSVSQNYTYDDLYRLTGATGSFAGSKDKSDYSLSMKYDNMGNVLSKTQDHTLNGKKQDATSYNFNYSYNGPKPDAASQIGDRAFTYDEDGNQLYWENNKGNSYRQLAWDEENRLTLIDDNGYVSQYVYDASGERAIRSQGGTRGAYVNGAPIGIINHSDNDYTAYISPYFVFQNDRFTKYYYAGNTRIAAKIGNGEFVNQYRPGVFEITAGSVNYISRQQQLIAGAQNYEQQYPQPPGPPTMKGINSDPLITGTAYPDAGTPDTIAPHGWPRKPVFAPPGGPPGAPIQWGDSITNDNVPPGFGYVGTGTIGEYQQYFYHTDHLGSTQYVTDVSGNVVQFIAYMPSGESFVDQHSDWDSPYKFNAKELDDHTGLYYYGTRYYDPETCYWLNTDPLSLNTPAWSPYAYTFDNPVIFTDPQGMLPLVHYLQSAGQYLNKSFSKVTRYLRGKKSVLQSEEENLAEAAASSPEGSVMTKHEPSYVVQSQNPNEENFSSSTTSATQPLRVFWSGGKLAMEAAMEYAISNGMITLEMTKEGQDMQVRTKNMPWSEAQPLWSELSADYARGAGSTVHVFHNARTGIKLNSVWRTTEYPILKNKNVNIIYHSVF